MFIATLNYILRSCLKHQEEKKEKDLSRLLILSNKTNCSVSTVLFMSSLARKVTDVAHASPPPLPHE